MISKIRHVGFVVKDLEVSLNFYEKILGLSIYKRFIEEGDFISNLTGIDNVKLEWVKLIIPEGGLIELLQYHSHPDSTYEKKIASNSNKIGCSHVALTIDKLDDVYNRIIEHKYICKSPPLKSPDGNAKVLYCQDPDGSIIELIEDLKN